MITHLFVLLATFTAPAFSESMGVSGGHDLDRLWSEAQKLFDLSSFDAVLLLESRHITISADGKRRTAVHRVVWTGTEIGIDDHADLRIPYNSATSTFTVTALRTWRDGAWWPDPTEISPTAVVETLPFAMARADDYTTMRETMLLHDGVEIPCIMETAYEIDERTGVSDGADGLYVFPQRDPAALVDFTLSIPTGVGLAYHSGNGAPEPAVTSGTDRTATYVWKMENLDRLGSPRITDPPLYAPYVTWSTWPDWNTLGNKIVSHFNSATVLDAMLADTLTEHLKHEPTPASKARKIVELINEYTRSIHYDSRFWSFSPRPATRTWETAYGHGLDRAVLAAALFRESGLDAEPLYRSIGRTGIDQNIPGLSRFEEIALLVSGGGLQALYDPAEGTLSHGPRPLYGLNVWKPGTEDAPTRKPLPADPESGSRFDLILTLEPDGDGGWSGTGFFNADGLFCPYGDMVGLHGEALAFIRRNAGSVMPETEIVNFNPETFERTQVTVGFELKTKSGEADEEGRTRLVIGDPAGGIIAALPPDVHTFHEHRTSPVVVPGKMTQRIRLRLRTGEREIVHLPEAHELENDAGRYTLAVDETDGWVTVERRLTLRSATITPAAWPLLRILLLEETDAAGRTLLLK